MKKQSKDSTAVYMGCELCGVEEVFENTDAASKDGWYVGKETDLCPYHARVMMREMGLKSLPVHRPVEVKEE